MNSQSISTSASVRRISRSSKRFGICSIVWAACLFGAQAVRAEVVVEAKPLVRLDGLESPPPSSDGVQKLLTEIIRSTIPTDYENTKDWGKTKEVKRGLTIRRDGLRITTKRKRRQVNHGTWKKYQVHLIDPDKYFRIRVENYVEQPNHRAAFDLVVDAKLDVFGRYSKWESGLQLISLGASAESTVELRVRCDVGLKVDPTKFPPDVMLDPKVTKADLHLREFRLRELSDLKGPLAKSLSSSVREILEDVIARKRERMVQKMNDKIDRSRDKLRLSLSDMLKTSWASKIPGASAITSPKSESTSTSGSTSAEAKPESDSQSGGE